MYDMAYRFAMTLSAKVTLAPPLDGTDTAPPVVPTSSVFPDEDGGAALIEDFPMSTVIISLSPWTT
jgi:hypothetical protein